MRDPSEYASFYEMPTNPLEDYMHIDDVKQFYIEKEKVRDQMEDVIYEMYEKIEQLKKELKECLKN